jgi:IMP dehydrogenase/GMP reductase
MSIQREDIVSQSLSFDDILLVPQYSEITSRKNIDTTTDLGNGVELRIPVIASPMDTVSGPRMAAAMAENGGLAIIHRYNTLEEQVELVKQVREIWKEAGHEGLPQIGAAVGVGGDFIDRALALVHEGVRIICIDVAHGDSLLMKNALTRLREELGPDIHIMAGNVATAEGYARLASWGADSVRLGIGSGCLAGDALIYMANGSEKRIDEIEPGDEVMNRNGDPVKVTARKYSGMQPVNRVISDNHHEPLGITEGHEMLTFFFDNANDLDMRSKLEMPHVINDSKWTPLKEFSSCERKYCSFPQHMDFQLPFDVEMEMGDTSVKTSNYGWGYMIAAYIQAAEHFDDGRFQWRIETPRKEAAHNLRNIVASAGWTNESFDAFQSKAGYRLVVKDERIIDMFKSIYDEKGKLRFDRFMSCNPRFIEGLYDGFSQFPDISIYNERRVENLVVRTRTHDVAALFRLTRYMRFGDTIEIRKNRLGWLCSPYAKDLSSRGLFQEGFRRCRINSVEECSEEVPTWDIEVDCPTHSFIANGLIVHNSICSTRIQTGHGVPLASTIARCQEVRNRLGLKATLIADGGIKNAGDAVKALAIGADSVMCGSLLAGTKESPGDVFVSPDGNSYKCYNGMSSRKAQMDWRGRSSAPEGIAATVPYKGPLADLLWDMVGNIRSGLSYSGAWNLRELRGGCIMIKQTAAGRLESSTHILSVR